MARNVRHSLTISAAVLALGSVLAACSPPNEVDSEVKVTTASEGVAPTRSASATTSSSTTAGATSSTTAASDSLQVSHTEQLAEGHQLTVNISGLDPAKGYYAAICATGTEGAQPSCTGNLNDPATVVWIKADNTGTAMLNPDGTATVNLTATATGEGVNCHTDKCAVKVYGDQDNGYVDYAEMPVTFAAQ